MLFLDKPGSVSVAAPSTAVVLTIDTEPDDAWSNHLGESVANVLALRRLASTLGPFGFRPTVLVTWRVLRDVECGRIIDELVADHGAEVGAHLHPWENPPFMPSGEDVKFATFPHELPLAVFREKMNTLTNAIAERFGRPTSYRAGRWGMAAEHVSVLEDLGYEVDTSVFPMVDWRSTWGIPRTEGGRGGIDYRWAPRRPYHPAYDDIACRGGARLTEIPVSVGFNRRISDGMASIYGRLPSAAQRILRGTGIARPVWATPAWEPRDRLLKMTVNALADRVPVLNIACHSSEFVVGSLPECGTPEKIDEIFARTAAMFETVAKSPNARCMTLTQAARASSQTSVSVSAERSQSNRGSAR